MTVTVNVGTITRWLVKQIESSETRVFQWRDSVLAMQNCVQVTLAYLFLVYEGNYHVNGFGCMITV